MLNSKSIESRQQRMLQSKREKQGIAVSKCWIVRASRVEMHRAGCSSARLEYASGGRVVASSNLVTPTDLLSAPYHTISGWLRLSRHLLYIASVLSIIFILYPFYCIYCIYSINLLCHISGVLMIVAWILIRFWEVLYCCKCLDIMVLVVVWWFFLKKYGEKFGHVKNSV